MLTLRIRKLALLAAIALIVILGNLVAIAAWLSQTGAIDVAQHIRQEYLTGTAITILVALLILIVSPGAVSRATSCTCPVCDKPHRGGSYCSHCGSRCD
ncbi:MAG: hypothetical protein ACE37H_07935 [Phycisphaeraceae bacterium]